MKQIFVTLCNNKLFQFLLIFIGAICFYLFNIGFSDLWSDETYTKSMLDGSLSEFFTQFKNDLHPPLYYLGLRLFTGLAGSSAVALRLFSVIGILSTLLLGYFAGQRVFGKQGALYFCILIISLPMVALYAHQARMYTWAFFSVTGVFLYSITFLKSRERKDLLFLSIFTLIAIYTHYYSMAAAFVANFYVFIYLLAKKEKKWREHILSLVLVAILFLPWLTLFTIQIEKVQHAFWAPEPCFSTILSCFTIPFTEQFWTSNYSNALIILMYTLITTTVILSFLRRFAEYRLTLWMSLTIFLATLLLASLISLFSQPILYSRYVMAIASMLVVAPTLLLMTIRSRWLKTIIIAAILVLGLRVSFSTYYFSYGPYKQTIEYIASTYPHIKKIVHLAEITAGPMIEYSENSGLGHYWLKAQMSNVDAFSTISQHSQPSEFLQQGEEFCVVRFQDLELNKENLDHILSESELIKKGTIRDSKVTDRIHLYLLKYKGLD